MYRRPAGWLGLGLTVWLVLGAIVSPSRTQAQGQGPPFVSSACPFELPLGQVAGQTVRCGYVVVPEDRAQPNGPRVLLPVAVFRSRAANPDPAPTIFFEGGPGGRALQGSFVTDLNDPAVADALLARRDLVVFDQRGTGLARPSLACPEVAAVQEADPDLDLETPEGVDRQQTPDELDVTLLALAACRDRLVQQGVNLAAYHTVNNAADVNDVARALGYSQLNLWGISYGTRLSLAVMRDFPQLVRSAVIDGVVPPDVFFMQDAPVNAARAFQVLFRGCAESPTCNTAYPRLEERFYDLVRRLDAAPQVIALGRTRSGDSVERVMTGKDVVSTLFMALYDTELIPRLPLIIDRASNGNLTPIANVSLTLDAAAESGHSRGMNLAMNCADMASMGTPETLAAIAARVAPEIAAGVSADDYFPSCALWDVPAASPALQQPLRSEILTLVLSGGFDPVTPPANGEHAATTLPRSFVYTLPLAGHGASLTPCGRAVMAAFWENPTQRPAVPCATAQTWPDWVIDDGSLSPAGPARAGDARRTLALRAAPLAGCWGR